MNASLDLESPLGSPDAFSIEAFSPDVTAIPVNGINGGRIVGATGRLDLNECHKLKMPTANSKCAKIQKYHAEQFFSAKYTIMPAITSIKVPMARCPYFPLILGSQLMILEPEFGKTNVVSIDQLRKTKRV